MISDPTTINLTREQEAICRQIGADWLPDLRNSLIRIDERLAAIEHEREHLLEMRAETVMAFESMALRARALLFAYRQISHIGGRA